MANWSSSLCYGCSFQWEDKYVHFLLQTNFLRSNCFTFCFLNIQCLSKGYKNEVLRLASVSTTVWDECLQVFNMFENGELKGQTLSKKQLLTKPEIKSTQFQCLFPLDEATQITLLQQLQSKAIGMKQMHQMAQKHKRMADLKAKFCHLTNVSDWKEATRKFPTHATDRALEQFSEIDVSKATPAVFSEYCTSAVRWQTAEEPTTSNILTFTHQKQLCWIIDGSPETYNPANLTALVPQFAGANLFYSYLSPVSRILYHFCMWEQLLLATLKIKCQK